MSRPSRIHDRRASSRRRLVDSATAVARPPAQARWLEHDHERLRSSGERRQAAEPVRDPGGLVRGGQPAAGQVQDEQVHRAAGQQRARDGQALVEGLRGDDHEPFEPDAAGDRLDRVEAARQVQPGHDRAGAPGPPPRAGGPASSGRSSRRRGSRRWPSAAGRPGPRIASSAANPVWMTRSSAAGAGSGRCDGTRGGCRGGREGEGPVRDRGGRVGRGGPRGPRRLRLPSEPGGSPRLPSRPGRGSPSDG